MSQRRGFQRFGQLLRTRTRRTGTGRQADPPKNVQCTLDVSVLEERLMMSAVPLDAAAVTEADEMATVSLDQLAGIDHTAVASIQLFDEPAAHGFVDLPTSIDPESEDSQHDSHEEHGPHEEHDDDHFDVFGNEFHALPVPTSEDAQGSPDSINIDETDDSLVPLGDTFLLHSNLGASHTIYLDFDGHTTSGTTWNSAFNGGQAFTTPAYDFDGNTGSFSNSELTRIQYIWQRVAEDFIAFDVDVTTELPTMDELTNSGGSDAEWGVRVVIGGSSGDWYGSTAGGVAYRNSFNYGNDTPAFVFEAQLGNGNEKYTAEAISHEVGHTLGLSHDGNSSTTYYRGHGSGDTGWAPIMGSGYYENLTQWSSGEYSGANNSQDDLSIITGNNGFGYRADDFGDSIGSADTLGVNGSNVYTAGIIETSSDYDVFSFTTTGGLIDLAIDGVARGTNLDIMASLYDAVGTLIVSSNPLNYLDAAITTSVAAGEYFLEITGVGRGDPASGYSDYASLGQYFVSGTIATATNDFVAITATDAVLAEGDAGTTNYTFTVTRTGDTSQATSVDYSVAGIGGDAASADDFAGGGLPGGTVNFAAGQTSRTITIEVAGDTQFEMDETFRVTLANAAGATQISASTADGTILADDDPLIGGIDTGVVTEDVDPDADGLLETSGTLTIANDASGQASFHADTFAGTYGELTMNAAGNWSYAADNTQSAIQLLAAGESLTDTITVLRPTARRMT